MPRINTPRNLGLILAGLMVLLAFTATMGQIQRGRRRLAARLLLWVTLLGYLSVFAWLTLFQRSPFRERPVLLELFYSYRHAFSMEGGFHVRSAEWARQVILNIWVMMPLSFLLMPLLDRVRGRSWITLLAGTGLSLTVEVCQYLFRLGYFELDDLMNNTLGCLMGLGLYLAAERLGIRMAERAVRNGSE